MSCEMRILTSPRSFRTDSERHEKKSYFDVGNFPLGSRFHAKSERYFVTQIAHILHPFPCWMLQGWLNGWEIGRPAMFFQGWRTKGYFSLAKNLLRFWNNALHYIWHNCYSFSGNIHYSTKVELDPHLDLTLLYVRLFIRSQKLCLPIFLLRSCI